MLHATGNGSITVDIGGATLATIDTAVTSGGVTAVTKTTVSTGGAAATGTINIKRSAGGLVRIIQVVARNSAIKKAHVLNYGASGWRTSDYADVTGAWSPARAVSAFGLDAAVIDLGLNDLNASVAVATSRANLKVLVDALQAAGTDVFLSVPHPQDPATRDPLGNTSAFNAMIYELADAEGCGVIDLYARQGSYALLSSSGMLRDLVHGKPELYGDNAEAMARVLLAA
jgi:hypothetical protein